MSWLNRSRQPASSLSRPMAGLALGFALLAAGTSSLGAWIAVSTMGLDPVTTKVAAGVLIFVSLMLVAYERSAISAIRSRRVRGDNRAARQGLALLFGACIYTGIMQITFFGSVFLSATAKDTQHESSITDVDRRIKELESEASWKVAVFADPDGLRGEIAGLEKQEAMKGKDFAASRAAAAAALPGKRAELSAVLRKHQIDRELADLREKRTLQLGQPTSDPKSKVLGVILGLVGIAAGDKLTYGLIMLGVALVQMGQIMLPAIAGKSEIIAARAASVSLVEEARVEILEPAKQQQQARLEPPRSEAITLKPLAGPMAQAALAQIAERQAAQKKAEAAAAKRKAPSKTTKAAPPPKPATGGLASKLR